MLSAQFINGKDLRTEIGNLNKAGVAEKLKMVGVKKEEMIKSFLAAVESVPEGSEEEKKIPESVTLMYNSILTGEDPPEGAQPVKKEKKVRGPSNEQIAYDMVKAGKSDDELTTVFTERYAATGKTDVEFIKKRVVIYKKIAEKKIAADAEAPPA